MARVSVCIPSYNAASHIAATIQSVLDSTYRDLEVIVNDDASTDNTCEIVAGFKDERVRLFRNERNLGPVPNWNRAMRRATGEFAGLLNHDDLYGPFWLSFAVHILDRYPHIGWVSTDYRTIDAQGRTIRIVPCFPETREYSREEVFLRLIQFIGMGIGYIARRSILEAIDYYDEQAGPGADNELFLRLSLRAPLYYSTNPYHAASRVHPGNLTHRWSVVDQARETFYILNKICQDEMLPAELRAGRATYYNCFYNRVVFRIKELRQRGEYDTADRLLQVLRANGYAGPIEG